MQRGKFNVVTDGQWGSCGKGLISSALAMRYRPEILSTTNMANAGHTAVNARGESFVAKALPAAAITRTWCLEGEAEPYRPHVLVGPTAGFDVATLVREAEATRCIGDRLTVHPRAGVIMQRHKEAESSNDGAQSTKHIASTMQGCAAMLAEKILRKKEVVLARDSDVLNKLNCLGHEGALRHVLVADELEIGMTLAMILQRLLRRGWTCLHEGSQGFSLDINWGSHYPHCTSRSTTAMQNAADMGIPAQLMGDVYLVIRPYPIRVGNVVENGQQQGYSGDCYHDQREITWQQVAEEAGMPDEEAEKLLQKELTTVTKRLRRVFSFSWTQLINAAAINGATGIVLNFANYIDWRCAGTCEWSLLPNKVLEFVDEIEENVGVPVVMIGTGPRVCDVCWREDRDAHTAVAPLLEWLQRQQQKSDATSIMRDVRDVDGETA